MKRLLWPTSIPKSNQMFSAAPICDHLVSVTSWFLSKDTAHAHFVFQFFCSLALHHHHAPKHYNILNKNNNNKINKKPGPFCTEPTTQFTYGCTDTTLKLGNKYRKLLLTQQWYQEIYTGTVKMQWVNYRIRSYCSCLLISPEDSFM